MRPFITPNLKVLEESNDNKKVKVEISPLEEGIAEIIAVPFRKIILSFLPGSAIYGIKIEKINSSTKNIPGILESTQQLISNIEGILLNIDENFFADEEKAVLTLNLKKAKTVQASDIICPDGVKIINKPDYYLFQLQKDEEINIELYAKRSRGFVEADINKKKYFSKDANVIGINSIYSVIDEVGYEIENFGFIDELEYKKLIFYIETKGVISAIKAFSITAKILINYFENFLNIDIKIKTFTALKKKEEEKVDLDQTLRNLNFPNRAWRALETISVVTLRQLLECSSETISKKRNIGTGTYRKIVTKLAELGLYLKD